MRSEPRPERKSAKAGRVRLTAAGRGKRGGRFERKGSYAEQAAAIAVMRLVACIVVPVRCAFVGMGMRSLLVMRMDNAIGMNVRLGGRPMHMRRAMGIGQAMRGGVREG